jgi:hypothetical protein
MHREALAKLNRHVNEMPDLSAHRVSDRGGFGTVRALKHNKWWFAEPQRF